MDDLTKQSIRAKYDAELLDILNTTTEFCKDYGYESLEMRIGEKDCFYNVCVILYSGDGKKVISGFIPKSNEIADKVGDEDVN